MQTQLVKVVPNAVSWFDWVWEGAKENPGKTVALSIAAFSFLPLELSVAATGTVVAGVVGLAVGAVGDIFRSSEMIAEVELKNSTLTDVYGAPITQARIYAHHPDSLKPNIVIPADTFHSTIIAEQIADLAAFIRSKVCAEKIEISVSAESGFAFDANAVISSEALGVKAHAGSSRHHSLELMYDEPDIVPLSRNNFWLRYFPEIEIAFENARKGKIKRSVSIDTTFGLSASLAKIAGIDTKWLGRQRFDVEATFA